MPVVARDGAFSFIVHTRELPFEPPHVHVAFGGEEVRIELLTGTFMDEPPPGQRKAIRKAYARHATELQRVWILIHG